MIAALKRPPFIGLFAFLLVFIATALGHSITVTIGRVFGEDQFKAAAVEGLIGAVIIYLGMRAKGDNLPTWLGFIGAGLVWGGWIEFSFIYYGEHLGVAPLMEDGRLYTRPEYMVMPSSVGVLAATLVYFFFNRETRCNAFRWMHKHLRIPVGKPSLNYSRNVATLVAMERIYIQWFFYMVLLAIYDKRILGPDHPALYGLLFVFVVWSVYLLNRLRKFTRLTSAFRYGIATALVAWNPIEILGKWHFLKEVWVQPWNYVPQMTAIVAAFVTVAVIFALFPATDSPDVEAALPAE